MTNAVASIATVNWRTSSGVPATPRIIWKIGQWNRYIPYDRVPIHNRMGIPRSRPVNERRCDTAAIINMAARSTARNPPRNSNGSGPSSVTMCSLHANTTSDPMPTRARPSRVAPLSRSGPRITATGRHRRASAPPTSNPVDRVSVDRYNVSVLLMACPPTFQKASGVVAGSTALVGSNTSPTATLTATAASSNQRLYDGSRPLPARIRAIITMGQTR